MPDDFRSIRSWDGSKDRAFEEICYQLLREPEDLPSSVVGQPIRTGNPDGGVEWYVKAPDSTQWGWQAKYIYETDSLLSAMTVTVRRVTKERPDLTKLIFCIPYNLPAGTAGGQRKSARQRYEDTVESWKKSIDGAGKIEFALCQESDLLDRLAMPKHAGRAWFWWNDPYLGPDWLTDFQRVQANTAGDRYRPILQVDVPIQDDLSVLGFADSYFDELGRHTELVFERLKDLSVPVDGLGNAIISSARSAVDAAKHLTNIIDASSYQAIEPDPLDKLNDAVTACSNAVSEAYDQARNAQAFASDDKPGNGRPSDLDFLKSHLYYLGRASDTLHSLRQYLEGSASRALRDRFYFLAGSAGTGKTHLCLDSAERALSEDRPAVVLFGGQLGAGDLWASICDQLGLPILGADTLLGALEATAEASAINGRRFVLMIDALNDTRAEDYWEARLPALRAKFAGRPLLSLVVSCRDTYLNYIDPENRCKEFIRSHPGFAGREIEATHKYFEHYGLHEPRIPLLLPEFTVPLFLLTYCEGLYGEGLVVPPSGHEGRVEIFERFLKVQLNRVNRRLGLAPGSSKVRTALDVLLDEMSSTGTEYVNFARAEELTSVCIPERTEWPRTALGALLSEGLLNEELTYAGDGDRERVVRVTYQAFSDFLILQRKLRDTPEGKVPDSTFAEWLENAIWGIREAAAALLPERYSVELSDLLEPIIDRTTDEDDPPWQAQQRLDNFDEMVVRSLPYRRARTITERSIDILNRHTEQRNDITVLLDTVFLCAPQPDSRLNGERLHLYLSQYSMPDRDESVGTALYYALDDEGGPLARLARWAAAGPYPEYDPQVVELACIPLVWMLSSPNRFARDWITKALGQLLTSHLDVAARLVERFATVNDPYVLERLITAAYGAVLRSNVADQDPASRLVTAIERCVFDRISELNPDALMLDAAHGIIEWAVDHELLPGTALAGARPPYGFKRPASPPTKERLEKLYPVGDGTSDETSYGSIHFSVLGFGDFGRYVIESGVRNFLRVPLSQPRPEPEPPREPKFLVTKWCKFEKSLSAEQRAELRALLRDQAAPAEVAGDIDEDAMQIFLSSLSAEQSRQFRDSWRWPNSRSRRKELSYSADLAQRWVMHRTMQLGWTPQRFNRFDRYVNYNNASRTGHKYERFGKKYQWIAYHELLARVADNYHFARPFSDDLDQYYGIHQLNDRDIDPSLPPVPYRELQDRVASQGTWKPLSVSFPNRFPGSVRFDRYLGDFEAFLSDQETLPYPGQIARIEDRNGESWVVLYAYASQTLRADRRDHAQNVDQQFFTLGSWLVQRQEASAVAARMPAELTSDSAYFSVFNHSGHTDCCYMGELGGRDMHCGNQQDGDETLVETDDANLKGFATIEEYTWEGSIWDCSIEESVHAVLPSTALQRSGGLRWSGVDRSWLVGPDMVICNVDAKIDMGTGVLLVAREDWLQEFLKHHGMSVVYGVRGERQHRGRTPEEYTWLEFELSGFYDQGNLTHGDSKTVRKWNQTG